MRRKPRASKRHVKRKPPKKKMLLGVGLDDPKGHTRITKGPDFQLYGGSQTTHEKMQELTIKSREQLRKKGKTFANASDRHVRDTIEHVAHKIGLDQTEEREEPEA